MELEITLLIHDNIAFMVLFMTDLSRYQNMHYVLPRWVMHITG